MQEDKSWDRIADAIDLKFGIVEHGRTDRPVADAPDLKQHISYITFKRQGELYKLERIQGPAIIDKKTIGARRAGAEVRHQYIYDAHETSVKTVLYRSEGDDWQAMDLNELGF